MAWQDRLPKGSQPRTPWDVGPSLNPNSTTLQLGLSSWSTSGELRGKLLFGTEQRQAVAAQLGRMQQSAASPMPAEQLIILWKAVIYPKKTDRNPAARTTWHRGEPWSIHPMKNREVTIAVPCPHLCLWNSLSRIKIK